MASLAQMGSCRLADLEQVIDAGLKSFVEVGNALLQIRDRCLYKATHATFESYCEERWGLSRPHAYRLMDGSEVVGNLSPIGDKPEEVAILPATESQARPLTRLEPDEQRTAWKEAVETAPQGKVTAAHVAAVAEKYRPKEPAADSLPDISGQFSFLEPMSTEMPAPIPGKMDVHHSSESVEWYTPKGVIDKVALLFGDIPDLDPCSNSKDSPHVPARKVYTKEDDGLTKRWSGKVYMNPPYGDEIGKWIDKAIEAFLFEEIDQAVLLLPARPGSRWFVKLAKSYARCEVDGRLKFSGSESSAPFPSILFYLGYNLANFNEIFSEIGRTSCPLDWYLDPKEAPWAF